MLAVPMQVLHDRADLPVLQHAAAVLYGKVGDMPYLRDLAHMALGLHAAGALAAACEALNTDHAQLWEELLASMPAARGQAVGAGGSEGGRAAVLGADRGAMAEVLLLRTLGNQLEPLAAEAEAEVAEALEAAKRAAEAEAARKAEEAAAAGVAEAMEVGEAAAAANADGAEAMEVEGGAGPKAEAEAAGEQHTAVAEGSGGDGAAAGDDGAAGEHGDGEGAVASQLAAPEAQALPARGRRAAAVAAAPARRETRRGAAAAAAAADLGAKAKAAGPTMANCASWVALLDALAPLCHLNLDMWLESPTAAAAAAIAVIPEGDAAPAVTATPPPPPPPDSKPSAAVAVRLAAAACRRREAEGSLRRPLQAAAAAGLLQEPLLRCFSLAYIQVRPPCTTSTCIRG